MAHRAKANGVGDGWNSVRSGRLHRFGASRYPDRRTIIAGFFFLHQELPLPGKKADSKSGFCQSPSLYGWTGRNAATSQIDLDRIDVGQYFIERLDRNGFLDRFLLAASFNGFRRIHWDFFHMAFRREKEPLKLTVRA